MKRFRGPASACEGCPETPSIRRAYIAEQLGHTDIRVTTRYYTKAVKRRSKLSGEYLAEFERALEWATRVGEKALNGHEDHSGTDQEQGRPTAIPSDLA